MTVDFSKLKSLDKSELISLAQQLNAPYNSKNSPEMLIESIINKAMENTFAVRKKDETPLAPKEPVFLTVEQIEAAIKPAKDRQKHLNTSYDDNSKSVTISYNDGRHKHSETMSLSNSLPKIVRKADEIAKGPYLLRAHQGQDWDSLGGRNPNNLYANTVLG